MVVKETQLFCQMHSFKVKTIPQGLLETTKILVCILVRLRLRPQLEIQSSKWRFLVFLVEWRFSKCQKILKKILTGWLLKNGPPRTIWRFMKFYTNFSGKNQSRQAKNTFFDPLKVDIWNVHTQGLKRIFILEISSRIW